VQPEAKPGQTRQALFPRVRYYSVQTSLVSTLAGRPRKSLFILCNHCGRCSRNVSQPPRYITGKCASLLCQRCPDPKQMPVNPRHCPPPSPLLPFTFSFASPHRLDLQPCIPACRVAARTALCSGAVRQTAPTVHWSLVWLQQPDIPQHLNSNSPQGRQVAVHHSSVRVCL
jgi:hypothetical protein